MTGSAFPAEVSYAAVVAALRAAGCVFAEDEATLLLAAAPQAEERRALVRRRIAGTPLEVLLGWAEFCGLRVGVDPGVFVPRRRTELLARQAIAIARSGAGAPPGMVVVDLCCGTGAVGLAVASALPGAELHAADIDPVAVACAAGNLRAVGGRAYCGDLYGALPPSLRGRVELLLANAPYVPTAAIALMPPEARVHEPRGALDGGEHGLDVQRRVIAGAADWLAPGGHVLVETSDAQGAATLALLSGAGLSAWLVTDEDLDATVAIGQLGIDS